MNSWFPILIAAANPEPAFLGNTVMALSALASTAAAVVAVVVSVTGRRHVQKREVRLESDFVPMRDFDSFRQETKKEHDQIHSKIGGVERGLRGEVKADVERLAEKVNKVDREVGALQEATKSQNYTLASIDSKVTKLLTAGNSKRSQHE